MMKSNDEEKQSTANGMHVKLRKSCSMLYIMGTNSKKFEKETSDKTYKVGVTSVS